MSDMRPFSELRESGLLWLVNASVFHPRGFALAIHFKGGEAIGWSLLGDGTEPWQYEPAADDRFAAAEATFAAARTVGDRGIGALLDESTLPASTDARIPGPRRAEDDHE